MNHSSRVFTCITKHDPLTPADGPIALLLEVADDQELPFAREDATPLHAILGPANEAKRRAWELAQKLIAGEPAFGGVSQLHVMEEVLIRALETIFQAFNLDCWLVAHGATECRFRAPSPHSERLRSIQAVTKSPYIISGPSSPPTSLAQKVRQRLKNNGATGAAESVTLAARRFFPNSARLLESMPRSRSHTTRGGWWFYTTAYTFTNIGLAYESHLPRKLEYLVDTSEPGGKPLDERGRKFHDLYSWANWRDLPSAKELDDLRHQFLYHIQSVPLGAEDSVARSALLAGQSFQTYLRRVLPLTCFHTSIFRNFLEQVQPELIVVGNAASEGPLLQLARQAAIPTVLLQHGILGDYYQLMNQPADSLLVRGDFWREFVAEPTRSRTHVLNIPMTPEEAPRELARGTKILFLTAVDAAMTNTHESDLRAILERLLTVAAEQQRTLIVRVHPMEPIGYYRSIVEEVCARESMSVSVEYSQGGAMDAILNQSTVAVTYSSTVFLDCLRCGIPILSFDWHDFAYKALIEKHRVFHFASNLAHLQQLVKQALRGELAASSEYSQFLAPTTREELSRFFESAAAMKTKASEV